MIQDNFSENLEITLMDSVTSVADGVLKLLVALLLRLQVRAPPRSVLHSDEVAEKKRNRFYRSSSSFINLANYVLIIH